MTGIDSPSWRLFTDGGFLRQVVGSDLAGWRFAAVSPDNFVQILCGPVVRNPRHRAFSGATSCSNNTAELSGLAEALRWICFLIPRGEWGRFFQDSKHAARVTLGVAHARRNIALARKCNELLLRSRYFFHIWFHHVFSHEGNADNECADAAASWHERPSV